MYDLTGKRILVTGGAGFVGSHIVDLLLEAGCDRVVVVDNMVRGQVANLAPALASRRVELVRGDIRDAALMRKLVAGTDTVFHQAALRITHCAAEPDEAMQVMVGATYDLMRLCVELGVRKVVVRLVGVGLRAGAALSHRRGPEPLRQPDAVRRGQGLRRGAAALVQRHVRARLRRAALLQRLWPAHGPARALHRGDGALDGADRGGRAADHLRRRAADHGHDPRHRRRAREPARGAGGRRATWCSTSRPRPRRACSISPGSWPPRWGGTISRRSIRRRARSTRCRAASAPRDAGREGLGFAATVSHADGIRDLVDWWRAVRRDAALQEKAS